MEIFDYSFWSVVPPLLTILLAIITKEVVLSLSIGVITGAFIVADLNPVKTVQEIVGVLVGTWENDELVVPGAITNPDNVMVLVFIVLIGAFIGLLVKSGGSRAFAAYLSTKINTKRRAGILVCIVGLLLLVDDYFDTLTNGTITKIVSDNNRISREKYSYYLDSTTVAVCQISPVSSWVAFMCALMASGLVAAGIEENAYKLFIISIPYNYFAVISILMLFCTALFGLNIGPMKRAEARAEKTGKLVQNSFGASDEDDFAGVEIAKGRPFDLLFPVIMLIVLVLLFMLYTGDFFQHHSIARTVNEMDGVKAVCMGFVVTVTVTMVYMCIRKVGNIIDLIEVAFVGVRSMMYAMVVLTLGWSLGSISEGLGAVDFMVGIFEGNVPSIVIPAILFIICGAITIALGGCWTTYAIMIPIVIPFAVGTDSSIILCLTAVVGGGGLGATCSPISDTTIVASMAAELSIIDHVKTQIPYALTCGVIATIGYLVSATTGHILIAYIVMLVLLAAAVFVLRRSSMKKEEERGNYGQ